MVHVCFVGFREVVHTCFVGFREVVHTCFVGSGRWYTFVL